MTNRLVIGLKSGKAEIRPFTPAQEIEYANRKLTFENVDCRRYAKARIKEHCESKLALLCPSSEFHARLADYTILVSKGRANWTPAELDSATRFETLQSRMNAIRARADILVSSIDVKTYRQVMDFDAERDWA